MSRFDTNPRTGAPTIPSYALVLQLDQSRMRIEGFDGVVKVRMTFATVGPPDVFRWCSPTLLIHLHPLRCEIVEAWNEDGEVYDDPLDLFAGRDEDEKRESRDEIEWAILASIDPHFALPLDDVADLDQLRSSQPDGRWQVADLAECATAVASELVEFDEHDLDEMADGASWRDIIAEHEATGALTI